MSVQYRIVCPVNRVRFRDQVRHIPGFGRLARWQQDQDKQGVVYEL